MYVSSSRTLRYILFHHQTTTVCQKGRIASSCVISSFITKPQPGVVSSDGRVRCVISSFITKPQHFDGYSGCSDVALYPLSSPNHNLYHCIQSMELVALYPLSSPNHNLPLHAATRLKLRYILFHHQTTTANEFSSPSRQLRYILFHHQTTTTLVPPCVILSCVISSFITKPQLIRALAFCRRCCVISSFITKPQQFAGASVLDIGCVISSFITKPQPIPLV